MAGADGKTIRVRCSTWDQVEAFYTEKLKGNILVVKMPFRPGIGEGMTVALGLPDGLVFAIDGTVMKIGGDEGGRVPVAVRLHGMTAEVRAQLKRLVGNARNAPVTPVHGTRAVGTRPPSGTHRVVTRGSAETVPPPPEPRVDEVPDEERGAWAQLLAMRERVLGLPARELLGVSEDAPTAQVREAYRVLALRVHPDRFRRYRSRSLAALASDIFVHLGRAAGLPPRPENETGGWLVALGDGSEPVVELALAPEATAPAEAAPDVELDAGSSSPYSELEITTAATSSGRYDDEVSFTTSVRMRALTAEDLFDEAPAQAAPVGPAALAARAQDLAVVAEPPAATPVPAPPGEAIEDPRAALEEHGRVALTDGRYREACEAFAAVLRLDPKNRTLRALYHVANGLDLRAKGEGVKARLQFETALAHDRDCEPARRALLPEPDKKGGIFKRLFDKT